MNKALLLIISLLALFTLAHAAWTLPVRWEGWCRETLASDPTLLHMFDARTLQACRETFGIY